MKTLFTRDIHDWKSWGKVYQDIAAWQLLVKYIFKKEGLPYTEIEYLTPGTDAVFKVGGTVVKIFAPKESGMDARSDYETELFGLKRANNLEISAPKLLANGCVHDKYDFLYMVMEYIYGTELVLLKLGRVTIRDNRRVERLKTMIKNLKLVKPSEEYIEDIRAYRQEFFDDGGHFNGDSGLRKFEDIKAWLEQCRLMAHKETVPNSYWVEADQYLLVREDERRIFGMINFRHYLNDYLAEYAGHIGYGVRPSERRKGYAKAMLALCLDKCREFGLTQVLITCDSNNEASRRTILACGGVFDRTAIEDDRILERYWITLNPILAQNKSSWNAIADSFFGATALPIYGCFCPIEDELHLFPDLSGKKVLDVGCGSGHSLKWCGNHGASELWGLDISERQLENAQKFIAENGYVSKLFCSPMEENPGLPTGYFDVVYSIYAIGWTVDLQTTFNMISSYLKKDGLFIFSWDHPFMHCVDTEDEKLIFSGNYFEQEPFTFMRTGAGKGAGRNPTAHEEGGNPLTLYNRRLSDYINALAKAGFAVEQIIEETDKEILERDAAFTSEYYAPCKAKKFPLSLIIKAKKL